MNRSDMTSEEIRRAGLEVLSRELGPVGMIRFLQQFETGRGDYTAERHRWLQEDDLDALVEKIHRRRKDRERTESGDPS